MEIYSADQIRLDPPGSGAIRGSEPWLTRVTHLQDQTLSYLPLNSMTMLNVTPHNCKTLPFLQTVKLS